MANTTEENVFLIAPELEKCHNPKLLALILEDVKNEVGSSFGKNQEKAQRYLAAHYLTLSDKSNISRKTNAIGPIKQEKTGDESIEYSDKGFKDQTRYDETSYGRVFMSIRKASILTFQVITP